MSYEVRFLLFSVLMMPLICFVSGIFFVLLVEVFNVGYLLGVSAINRIKRALHVDK